MRDLRHMPPWPVLLGLALAACAAPPDADIPISEAAAARPAPRLAETAMFSDALDEAAPAVERLEARRDALAAQAETLRSRAAALSGPVIEPDAQARLRKAAGGAE